MLDLERIEKVEEKTQGRPREIFKILRYELNEKDEIRTNESDNSQVNSFNSFNSSGETKDNLRPHCPGCDLELEASPSGFYCRMGCGTVAATI